MSCRQTDIQRNLTEIILPLKAKINQSAQTGTLVFLEPGISSIAGKYKSDPPLPDICEGAYRKRDEASD
jgi:hypothetical protein